MRASEAFDILNQLRKAAAKSMKVDIPKTAQKEFSKEEAKKIGDKININWDNYSLDEFHKGINIELEHKDVTVGDPEMTGKIAFAHIKEIPNYYELLEKYVEKNH